MLKVERKDGKVEFCLNQKNVENCFENLSFFRNVVKLEKGLDTLRKVGKYLEKLEGTGRQERSKPGKITKLKR